MTKFKAWDGMVKTGCKCPKCKGHVRYDRTSAFRLHVFSCKCTYGRTFGQIGLAAQDWLGRVIPRNRRDQP